MKYKTRWKPGGRNRMSAGVWHGSRMSRKKVKVGRKNTRKGGMAA